MSTQTTPYVTVVPEFPVGSDRCDQCSAAAQLQMKLAAGGELIFCGHHANKFHARIMAIAAEVAVLSAFKWQGLELVAA